MKISLSPSFCFLALVPAAFGQSIFHQSFNNSTATFTDALATDFNWNVAGGPAADVNPSYLKPLTGFNVSGGNTDPGTLLPGEATRGRGFLFGTVSDGSTPGAYIKYTTHTGVSTVEQNNPQPDWFRSGPAMSFDGLSLGAITDITVRANLRTAAGVAEIEARLGLRVNGEWYFSATPFSLLTSWGEYSIADPASQQWISGVFDPGVSLDTDLSSPTLVTLSATDMVDGYAWGYWIGDLTGNDAWGRMDRIVVTAVPEPRLAALAFGALALVFVVRRRHRA
ncbi:MAG: hypothetical protein JJT96_15320 [Opitutales bacterium]|nr:hypothetical protein [Opitutales bacterium]